MQDQGFDCVKTSNLVDGGRLSVVKITSFCPLNELPILSIELVTLLNTQ